MKPLRKRLAWHRLPAPVIYAVAVVPAARDWLRDTWRDWWRE